MTLLQTDPLAPEQSISPAHHGSWLVGADVTHARDSFQAATALEPRQPVSACLGPVSSPEAALEGGEVLDLTELGAPAARRPP